jgi:hypothetical protein
MIREELRTLPTGPQELRKFGLLVGGIFAVLGAWWAYRGFKAGPVFMAVGAPLIVLGFAAPMLLRRIYLAWMALALVMGLVVGTVLLTVFYFCVMAPVTLIAKMAGADFMAAKWDKAAETYWVKRKEDSTGSQRYERQF